MKATLLIKEEEIIKWRATLGKSFTPAVVIGTFDILHPGNLTVVEKAANVSEIVCAVLEPDVAKGNSRHYQFIIANPLLVRMELISHLKHISAVTACDAEHIERCFKVLQPYKLVDCGANYSKVPIRIFARKYAEKVFDIPPVSGSFTRDIDEAITAGKAPVKVEGQIDKKEKENLLTRILEQRDKRKKCIVTVNGCFDVLHIGHMALLESARKKGDYLIVLVNDDKSVKSYKGEKRPIFPIHFRIRVLEEISHVSLALPFSDDTPLKLLKKIKPEIHVKGGSYDPERVRAEVELLNQWSGRVEFIPMLEGYSTTKVIEKLKSPS